MKKNRVSEVEPHRCWFPILLLVLASMTGCVPLALRFSPSLVMHMKQALFEECDPEIASHAIPANLKLLEGIRKSDPTNRDILLSLCLGFTGYSMLFVEDRDPERASALYLRARDYGLQALGKRGFSLTDTENVAKGDNTSLRALQIDDAEILLWTSMAWSGWVNLNLDKPAALAQLHVIDACIARAMELNGDYMFGLPSVLMGASLAARPPLFGGNIERARTLFENAYGLSHGKFFLVSYYYARYYAVRTQDKALFDALLQEIQDSDPGVLKAYCLINTIIQEKARALGKRADEYFI